MICRYTARLVARLDFRETDPGARLCEPRPRLRDVGAGVLADVEALVGGADLLFQEDDVAAADVEDGDVAPHVHVRLRGVEQDVLHRIAQQLAARQHAGFRAPDRIPDTEAGEEVLRDLQPVAAGCGRVVIAEARWGGWCSRP